MSPRRADDAVWRRNSSAIARFIGFRPEQRREVLAFSPSAAAVLLCDVLMDGPFRARLSMTPEGVVDIYGLPPI